MKNIKLPSACGKGCAKTAEVLRSVDVVVVVLNRVKLDTVV